jgi:hypothetical protein
MFIKNWRWILFSVVVMVILFLFQSTGLNFVASGFQNINLGQNRIITRNGIIEFLADTVHKGSGFGFPGAEIYSNSNAIETELASQNTWYKVEVFESNGYSNLMTANAAQNCLDVQKDGSYFVFINLSTKSQQSNIYKFSIFKNEIEQGNLSNERHTTVAGKIISIPISGFISVQDGDVISLKVKRIDGGAVLKKITISFLNLSALQVGG